MATVVDSEAAWLAADPAVNTLVAVAAYARKPPPANIRRAVLWRRRRVERRLDIGHKEIVHHFVVTVTWPQTSGAAEPADDQRRLDAAVEALVARVRGGGLADGHTHGGLFLSVAEEGPDGAEVEVEQTIDPTTVTSPATDADEFRVEVRYAATELIVA